MGILLDPKAAPHKRLMVVASLSDQDPGLATETLRSLLWLPASDRSSDLTCAALTCLGVQAGPDATSDIEPFLGSRSWQVRGVAFWVAGFVADLRLLPRMWLQWEREVRRLSSVVCDVLRYMGRHFEELSDDEQRRVLREGHHLWEKPESEPRGWIELNWPAMASGAEHSGPVAELLTDSLANPQRVRRLEWGELQGDSAECRYRPGHRSDG